LGNPPPTANVKLTVIDTLGRVRLGYPPLPPSIQFSRSKDSNDPRDRAVRESPFARGPSRTSGSRFPPVFLSLLVALPLIISCAETVPTFEEVKPAAELYQEGLETLEGRSILWMFTWVNYNLAIETFQSIIDNYPYSDYEQKALLKIADAYYADHRFEEALAYYQDFSDLHPAHEKVPYTLLRIAQCHLNQIESIDRDQTATNNATEALESLIRAHPYAVETREAEDLMVELRTRLALNMFHIADFYRDRTHWQSAAVRYRRVLDEFPGLGLDARALYRLGVCLEEMRRQDEALRLYHVVVENYAESPSASRARSRIARAE